MKHIKIRQFIIVGAALSAALSVFLVYTLTARVDNLKQEIQKNKSILQQINVLSGELNDTTMLQRKDHSSLALMSTIQVSLGASSLTQFPSKIVQEGADKIKLSFASVDFDKLLMWLFVLRQKEGVIIQKATIDQLTNAHGLVSAIIILS